MAIFASRFHKIARFAFAWSLQTARPRVDSANRRCVRADATTFSTVIGAAACNAAKHGRAVVQNLPARVISRDRPLRRGSGHWWPLAELIRAVALTFAVALLHGLRSFVKRAYDESTANNPSSLRSTLGQGDASTDRGHGKTPRIYAVSLRDDAVFEWHARMTAL
jgi:hypothetical protein